MPLAAHHIPGNSEITSRLVDLLRKRSVIAYVGAGASIDVYGSWHDLIEYLLTKANNLGIAGEREVAFWRRYSSRRPQYVVRAIKRAFGDERTYYSFLKDHFQVRTHPHTKKTYSPLHEAIVRLPLKGVVTTNYDPCLTEALRVCKPEIGSDPLTWQDKDYVRGWYTGDAFTRNDEVRCPLLHLHGVWNRPETLILDDDTYRRAYSDEVFRRTLEHLWAAEHLLLIGVGFSDAWLDRTLDHLLTPFAPGQGPRHFAVLGLAEEDSGSVGELRRLMEYAYDAFVLFYPIRCRSTAGKRVEDHSDLLELLGMFLSQAETGAAPRRPETEVRRAAKRSASWSSSP